MWDIAAWVCGQQGELSWHVMAVTQGMVRNLCDSFRRKYLLHPETLPDW